MVNILKAQIDTIKTYSKLVDYLYLILYSIMFIIAVLLSLGYQDIVNAIMPSWDLSYLISNLIIAILSIVAVYLTIAKKRVIAFYYVSALALFFVAWTLLEAYILLFHHIQGGIIFRMSFNTFISIMLIFRIWFINLAIKEGI